jgi:hypothetical protein
MSNNYCLFLDDYRHPKCLKDTRTWEVVRSYNEFVDKITKCGLPQFISFDHDLAWGQYPQAGEDQNTPIDYNNPRYAKEKTGYHCAKWLVDYCKEKNLPLPDWQTHSMNPVGRININQLLLSYRQYEYRQRNDTPES